MTPESFTTIRDKAKQFVVNRVHALLAQSGQHVPPFDPEKTAPLQRVKSILREDMGNLDALLIPEKDGYIIKINAAHTALRQRFSCAHEIIHTFFFDEPGKSIIGTIELKKGRAARHSIEEQLCNLGASELLMPYDIFRQAASRYDFSIDCLTPLAAKFRTSIQATAVRLPYVSPRQCFVEIRSDFDPEVPEMLVEGGKTLPGSVSALKYRRTSAGSFFVRQREQLVNKSFTDAAFRSDRHTADQSYPIGKLKKRCRIESQAFGYGRNRYVVSLIFPQG